MDNECGVRWFHGRTVATSYKQSCWYNLCQQQQTVHFSTALGICIYSMFKRWIQQYIILVAITMMIRVSFCGCVLLGICKTITQKIIVIAMWVGLRWNDFFFCFSRCCLFFFFRHLYVTPRIHAHTHYHYYYYCVYSHFAENVANENGFLRFAK